MPDRTSFTFGRHEFPDEDISTHLLESMRSRNAPAIQTMAPTLTRDVYRLVIIRHAMMPASPTPATAMHPSLADARSDYKDQPGNPIADRSTIDVINILREGHGAGLIDQPNEGKMWSRRDTSRSDGCVITTKQVCE